MDTPQPKEQTPGKIILTDAPVLADQRENGTEEKPLHRYFVAIVWSRNVKHKEDGDAMEIRHAGIEVQGETADAGEWLAKKIMEGDNQFPSGFLFQSAISKQLDE